MDCFIENWIRHKTKLVIKDFSPNNSIVKLSLTIGLVNFIIDSYGYFYFTIS